MIINLTLLIQVINFFFAYALLRMFFFVPLLQFIEEDTQRKKILENVMLQLEEQVVSLKKKQQKQRDSLKAYFLLHQPNNAIESIVPVSVSMINKSTIDYHGQEVIQFKKELKIVLQKKFWL